MNSNCNNNAKINKIPQTVVILRHTKNHPVMGWFAKINLEAAPRFELGNKGFADLCLTTWLCRHSGAENEIRTRDPRLGKAMLYH
ncbi:Hypothetical protein LUCI_1517 [Lucifera butyrica]|uniref:Uncharacterized protein n=1 Tax=Lucifera butyrica TaxID=1351585 RepID=A0A498R568_9FIRM|nr:Hypothetical protein LUCI_1517 [Lucifera butyrica]